METDKDKENADNRVFKKIIIILIFYHFLS